MRTNRKELINLSSGGIYSSYQEILPRYAGYQLTVPDLPLTRVYNRDQVPMALVTQFTSTTDVKNKGVI